MKHLTIRNVPEVVAAALEQEKSRRGVSLNRTVIALLAQGLGIDSVAQPSNGLAARFAGTWSDDEFREFEDATADLQLIDKDLSH